LMIFIQVLAVAVAIISNVKEKFCGTNAASYTPHGTKGPLKALALTYGRGDIRIELIFAGPEVIQGLGT